MNNSLINEQQEMATVNMAVAFDYLEFLLSNPAACQEIPDGATVIIPTGIRWVDEENQLLAKEVECSGGVVYHVPELGKSDWVKEAAGKLSHF
ncbi:MAG: hypothetical protein GDA56_02120 [Hormoscilla sp. GM7CHS1pb]|nr:hypothetical protein [Hormoscilla sp. GM7CHS1pb]